MTPRSHPLFSRSWPWLLLAVVLTFISLYPNLNNGFVNWDDDSYVTRNPLITELSVERIVTIFETPQVNSLYHPLTLITFSVDHAIGGMDPFIYHLTNILLHLANVVLVFIFLKLLTGRIVAAFTGALLFGIHPMHLESVAWISERKDVLYAFFFIAGLILYLRYLSARTKRGRSLRYAGVLLCFLLALLSKGMAITFPLLLLLVDYFRERKFTSGVVLEKLPFFALAVVFSWIAYRGQQVTGAISDDIAIGLHESFFVASRNFLVYLVKALVPYRLSPFHPYAQEAFSVPWYMYASVVPVAALAWLTFRSMRRTRVLFFGLAFFALTIGPVLQLIPFGKTILSERYTYVPYIGLFFLMGWGLSKLLETEGRWRAAAAGGSAVVLLLFGYVTWSRAAVWKNGEALWSDVIAKYPNHYYAYNWRGSYRVDHGEPDSALADLDRCLALSGGFPDAHYERARLRERLGQPGPATADYNAALRIDPEFHYALLNRGLLKARMAGDPRVALEDVDEAVRVAPDYALAWLNRGVIHEILNDTARARRDYSEAIRLEPDNAVHHRYRGVFHAKTGHFDAALHDYARALELDPGYANVHYLRSKVFRAQGRKAEALREAEKAQAMSYELPAGYLQSLR